MKPLASISLRISMALLLVAGTAGVSVHQHLCAMMGVSVSLERQVSCCGERAHPVAHAASDAQETLSRTPCCDDAIQSASVDTHFESAPAPRPALLAVTALHADDEAAAAPLFDRLPQTADDISPHIRRSLAETVNNLLS